MSALPSSPPRRVPKSAGHGSTRIQRKVVALNSKTPRIEGRAKRRRPMQPPGDAKEARERFARTFADVLSERFGGRWTVKWETGKASPATSNRDKQSLIEVG